MMPANVRSFYPTRESVRMENRFSTMAITVPITQSMRGGYAAVRNVTRSLKGAMATVYTQYAI